MDFNLILPHPKEENKTELKNKGEKSDTRKTSKMTHLVGRILDDHQQEVLVRSHHNFMLLGSNSQKCQIIPRIQIAYGTSSFVSQLAHQAGILNGCRIIQCTFYRNALNDKRKKRSCSFICAVRSK